MIRTGLIFAALVCLGTLAGLHHPAITAIPLSIMLWRWSSSIRAWWYLRAMAKEIDLKQADLMLRSAIAENASKAPAYRPPNLPADTVELFARVLQAATRVFPKSADPRYPLGFVILAPSGTPQSPMFCRLPGKRFYVLYPASLLSLSARARQFIFAHEVAHFCLRKTWHHVFPRVLYWIATVAALATAALPHSFSLFALSTFVAVWIGFLLLVHFVSRYAERRADDGAVRICLELGAEKGQPVPDWGNVVAEVFEAFLPQHVKALRNHGYQVFWRSSVAFGDTHPPARERSLAVRARVARFRQLMEKAGAARQKFLGKCRASGRRCDCGSGEWFAACCGRMPTFNETPWRFRSSRVAHAKAESTLTA